MMKTFQNISKKEFNKELERHRKLDMIVQGSYGEDSNHEEFKGCMMGCAVDSIKNITGKELSNNIE